MDAPKQDIIEAAAKLIRAKIRWKGPPYILKENEKLRNNSWTMRELELYDALISNGWLVL